MNTSIMNAWNSTIISEDREQKPRDYMYASELGSADIDVYLKMKGVEPTNRPDERARRKFDAGNHHEGLVQKVLNRLGIVVSLEKDAKRVKYQPTGKIGISGRFDLLLNGESTPEKLEQAIAEAQKELDVMVYDDPFKEGELRKTILGAKYYLENGITLKFDNEIAEVKSISVYGFNNLEVEETPKDTHALQAGFYVAYNNLYNTDVGRLFYISRDDLRFMEFGVSGNPTAPVQQAITESLDRKSHYYLSDERPPLEKMMNFDNGKFSMNFNVLYSNYLEMLYGFAHSESYREVYGKKVSSFNRVIKRKADGAKMTKLNEEILTEIEKDGFDIDQLVAEYKDNSIVVTEEGK